ncbi:hypothetical protein D3C76_1310550 [compost metagenome]
MLNSDTYPRLNQAGALMLANEPGNRHKVNAAMAGNASTNAQEITCQPPSVRDSFAPSA